MKLTLAQLEAFFWVTQLGSVQLAARKLNLAQPTISLRLRDLEVALDVQLFERSGRGIRPTEGGLKLQQHAALVLNEVKQMHEQTRGPEVSGIVRIGFAEGFAMVCLAPVLKVLQGEYPLLRPELVVSPSVGLEKDLIERKLDLAFLVNPIGHPSLHLQSLGTQSTVWAASPSWGLPSRIRPTDLRICPIITNPPPSAMHRQISDWFATAGLEPTQLIICTSVASVAHLVSEGAAIGLLPQRMIERQIASGAVDALVAVPRVEDGRIYAATWEREQTNASAAVVKSMRKVLSTLDYTFAREDV
jgi:DNA-binding transcriptional LysR family regulator